MQTWSLLPKKKKRKKKMKKKKGWVALASSLRIKTTWTKGKQAGDLLLSFFFVLAKEAQIPASLRARDW